MWPWDVIIEWKDLCELLQIYYQLGSKITGLCHSLVIRDCVDSGFFFGEKRAGNLTVQS